MTNSGDINVNVFASAPGTAVAGGICSGSPNIAAGICTEVGQAFVNEGAAGIRIIANPVVGAVATTGGGTTAAVTGAVPLNGSVVNSGNINVVASAVGGVTSTTVVNGTGTTATTSSPRIRCRAHGQPASMSRAASTT